MEEEKPPSWYQLGVDGRSTTGWPRRDIGEGKTSRRTGLQAVPVVVRSIEMDTEVQKCGSARTRGVAGLAGCSRMQMEDW